ncbi:MAG: YcnI family protein [Rhodoferax sp.]|nr:YcnI family protein [Rhodoferax sp.]
MKHPYRSLAACAALFLAHTVQAHVVLQDGAAAAGASYRAAFQIGHGCDGAATTAIRVRIPEGFAGAKPMPKPGWTLTTSVARLARPYSSHGKTITEDVSEVRWVANGADNALPDTWFDEFVLRGTTPAKAGALWFQVLQSCEKGELDWSQIPASGTSTQGLKAPAALLEVIDTGAAAHTH